MRRTTFFTLPLLLLVFTGCGDQTTAPDDIQAQFAKPVCPGPHPSCKPDDPGGDPTPVDPTFLFSQGAGKKLGFSLFFMDMAGNRARALSDADEVNIESVSAIWSPDGTQFIYTREVVIRKTPNEFQIMIGSQDAVSGDWTIEQLPVPFIHPEALAWSPEGWILLDANRDLWTVKPNTDGLTRLTTEGDIYGASWSTDGKRILAYIPGGLRLYTVDCDINGCVQTENPREYARAYFEDYVGSLWDLYPGDWGNTEANKDMVLCAISLKDGGTSPWDVAILDLTSPDAPTLANLTNTRDSGESQSAWSPDDSHIVHNRWGLYHTPEQLVIRNMSNGESNPLADANINWGVDWRPTQAGGS